MQYMRARQGALSTTQATTVTWRAVLLMQIPL
jgi:hypothetical protein